MNPVQRQADRSASPGKRAEDATTQGLTPPAKPIPGILEVEDPGVESIPQGLRWNEYQTPPGMMLRARPREEDEEDRGGRREAAQEDKIETDAENDKHKQEQG